MIASGDLHFGLTLEVLFREHESKPWSPMIAWLMQERGRRDDDGRSALDQYLRAGVVHSGQCFCPFLSPERIGNHCGRGTPLRLLCRLPPSWPARYGLGLGDARCGESVHRSSPCRVSGAPGLGGGARSIRPLGACMTNPACGGVIRNSVPGIPAAAGSPSLGSVTCACALQSLAGRGFRRVVTTGAAP